MRKTLVAGLLLLLGCGGPLWAAPPDERPGGDEAGLWGDVRIEGRTTLKVLARGQRLTLTGYATSLNDEFLIRADQRELGRIASLFGAQLSWNEDEETLRCVTRGTTRWIKLHERKVQGLATLPGEQEAELPIESQRIDGVAYVPLSVLEDFLETRVTAKPNQLVYIEPLIRSVRFEGSARNQRLVIESTAPVSCRAFTLKGPDRYVIDVAGAVLDTPALTVQHPDLGAVRLGQFELGPAISRIVIPMQGGVQIRPESAGPRELQSWQMTLPKQLAQAPDKIVIEDIRLEKTDKGHRLIVNANEPIRYQWHRLGDPNPRWLMDIPQALLKDPQQKEFPIEGKFRGTLRVSQNQPEPNPVVRVVVDLESAVEVNTVAGVNDSQLIVEVLDKELDVAASVPQSRGSTEQGAVTGSGLIVIDPGHGGSDPGALNKGLGLSEASVTLDICKRLALILKAQGWTVVMTRTTDVDVSYRNSSAREELGARVKVANQAKADIFLSVHCNASVSPSSNGTSLHYYKQSDYVLASNLQQAVLSSTGRNNRGLQANRFYVLAHSTMPAVLVETAFLTNPTEGALLGDPNYRQKIAEGLAQGLRQYATKQLNWGTANK